MTFHGVPWNKGKSLSKETREKMSRIKKAFFANCGRHPLLGRHHTEETRKKISRAHLAYYAKGNKPWNFGKHGVISQTARKRMSDLAKLRFKNVENHPSYGKHLSEDIREKIRLAHIGLQHSEQTKNRLHHLKFGKRVSLETRMKQSKTLKAIHNNERIHNEIQKKIQEANRQRGLDTLMYALSLAPPLHEGILEDQRIRPR